LKRAKNRVYALFVLTTGNPRIKKQNVLLTIGNGVSVLVIIVTHHFSYILINAKELAKEITLDLHSQILNIQVKVLA
jgi:hypothetical protein